MQRAAIAHYVKRILVLVLVVGMSLLSFGHHASVNAAPLDADTVAYLQSGGQLSDLCNEVAGDGEHVSVSCPLCLLSAEFALPDTMPAPRAATMPVSTQSWTGHAQAHDAHVLDPSRPSRAPPRI